MATEIRVPTLGESVTEATIGRWFKKPGEPVKADEPLVELETDKVTLEVNAPAAGVLGDIVAKDGDTVGPGAVLGSIVEGNGAGAKAAPPAQAAPPPAPTRTRAPPAPRSPRPRRLVPAKDSGPGGRETRERERRRSRGRAWQWQGSAASRRATCWRRSPRAASRRRRFRPVNSSRTRPDCERPQRQTTPRAKSGCV